MDTIYDSNMLRHIIRTTCLVLKENFYYDLEELESFISRLTHNMAEDLESIEQNADDDIVETLLNDYMTRRYFTIYFTGAHLRDIFIRNFHFSEQEMAFFENFLASHSGEFGA